MSILSILQWICVIPVIVGSLYGVVCLLCVVRYRSLEAQSSPPPGREWPPVTILKPVCGLEKSLRDNLRSACLQDYPEFQVVFSVQDRNDPALPLLEELQQEFGPARVSVAIEHRQVGTNGKINNLIGGLIHARHEILVISDSDVYLKPDYLKAIVAPLADPDVGFVCTYFMATSAESWFEKMELLTLNAGFFPDTVFAYVTGTAKFCNGSSMAFRRSTLDEIGGLESLADYLVEDYEMGRRIWETGKKMAVAPYVVETAVDLKTSSQWWNHQVYWDQNSCVVRPGALISTLVIRPVPFALLFAAARLGDPLGLSVLAGALALRLVTTAVILGWGLRDREGLRSLMLLPFRDLAAVVSLLLAFMKPTTVWRDKEFFLTRDGHMVARGVPLCESSSSPETTSALPSR
ncbi:MAG TPA: bacteriohopanetetrol glucosamine biosynthesis glycosyltransferase HpnI [Nitrospirales bacterium]|nr:bacteriohopanetetrol glucosamine biosynthesis glycosyltransferase HpnI [Nitrospirales bacterium]